MTAVASVAGMTAMTVVPGDEPPSLLLLQHIHEIELSRSSRSQTFRLVKDGSASGGCRMRTKAGNKNPGRQTKEVDDLSHRCSVIGCRCSKGILMEVEKNPAHSPRRAQASHKDGYVFFHAEMDCRANSRMRGSHMQSGILYTEGESPRLCRYMTASASSSRYSWGGI